MRYERTFRFSAAHFNDLKSYKVFWAWNEILVVNNVDLLSAFQNIHGHNYKVVVTCLGDIDWNKGWLIDDPAVEEIVMEWSNTNLSVHKDFLGHKRRATTEFMAKTLRDKLNDKFNLIGFQVAVWETEDIVAHAP